MKEIDWNNIDLGKINGIRNENIINISYETKYINFEEYMKEMDENWKDIFENEEFNENFIQKYTGTEEEKEFVKKVLVNIERAKEMYKEIKEIYKKMDYGIMKKARTSAIEYIDKKDTSVNIEQNYKNIKYVSKNSTKKYPQLKIYDDSTNFPSIRYVYDNVTKEITNPKDIQKVEESNPLNEVDDSPELN